VAWALLAVLVVAGSAAVAVRRPAVAGWIEQRVDAMPSGKAKRIAALALAWLAAPTAARAPDTAKSLPPPPPTVIGMNAPAVNYFAGAVPFANLLIGSEWVDAHYAPLPAKYQDADGNLLAPPPEGYAQRQVTIPSTGPEGIEIRCTWTGSGAAKIFGGGQAISSGPGSLRFRAASHHGQPGPPWLIMGGINPARPMRDIDCRDARLPRTARFRPENLRTLSGYGVIRFMDWQNANGNAAVTWANRHKPSGNLVLRDDGVSIEDMMALADQLGADPWFVMPWNADATYIDGFARLIARTLPANRHVYVEVGNEVWNGGFAVARQAVAEGHQKGLGGSDMEAGMHRYAQRTVEVMKIWEAAFAGRKGLVRVLSTQHSWPDTARTALGWGDVAAHVDALATAPYFGEPMGGTGNTRESVIARLSADIDTTLAQAAENRRIAASYGKRYIGYEGGEGMSLPGQPALAEAWQHDPAQADLYRRYLAGWKRQIGDTLCLLTSVSPASANGAWGLQSWEDETLAEAPRLRAVREFAPAR
jgi:hypothetical protein